MFPPDRGWSKRRRLSHLCPTNPFSCHCRFAAVPPTGLRRWASQFSADQDSFHRRPQLMLFMRSPASPPDGERVVPTCRGQPPAGHVPCPSAAVPAQPTEFCFPAAAVRAVASVPSRFKGGQVRQACHQFTTTAMEGLPVHGVLRASLPDWVSCLAGRSHVEDRFPAGVTGKMPSPSAQHRLVLPYSNQ